MRINIRILINIVAVLVGIACHPASLFVSTVSAQVSKPELVKTMTIEGEASALEVADNNVFVAHRSALGEPQIIRVYLGDPARPKIEEHFNVPLDVRTQFVDLLPKNGRVYAANEDGLWMSNNHYEMDQIVSLEGAHAIADFGDDFIAAIGTHRLIFLDTARNNTQVGEFISATPLTALAVGAEHRAFVADSFNGGSVRSFRLMRPDEGWGVLNEGGVSRLGEMATMVKVGEQLWAAGSESFFYLNLNPFPTMKEERVSGFLNRMINSNEFVVEIFDDWLHVVKVGRSGEVGNGYGKYVATLMSIQDPLVDAQTLGADHLVVIHRRAELEIYRFGEDQEPTATATPVATPTCTGPNCPIVHEIVRGKAFLPATFQRHWLQIPAPRIGTPPANTPEPVPSIRPTGVATEEPRVPPTVQP